MKKKILLWLIARFNKKADKMDKIFIQDPVLYKLARRSTMNVKGFQDKDPEFLRRMIGEKAYDLRHELVDILWREGMIDSEIETNDNEIYINLKIGIYGNRKDENSDDGILGTEESTGDTNDRQGSRQG